MDSHERATGPGATLSSFEATQRAMDQNDGRPLLPHQSYHAAEYISRNAGLFKPEELSTAQAVLDNAHALEPELERLRSEEKWLASQGHSTDARLKYAEIVALIRRFPEGYAGSYRGIRRIEDKGIAARRPADFVEPVFGVYETPGTRLKWSTLGEWLTTWMVIDQRPPSAARHSAQKTHLEALPDELVFAGDERELTRLKAIVKSEEGPTGNKLPLAIHLKDIIEQARQRRRRALPPPSPSRDKLNLGQLVRVFGHAVIWGQGIPDGTLGQVVRLARAYDAAYVGLFRRHRGTKRPLALKIQQLDEALLVPVVEPLDRDDSYLVAWFQQDIAASERRRKRVRQQREEWEQRLLQPKGPATVLPKRQGASDDSDRVRTVLARVSDAMVRHAPASAARIQSWFETNHALLALVAQGFTPPPDDPSWPSEAVVDYRLSAIEEALALKAPRPQLPLIRKWLTKNRALLRLVAAAVLKQTGPAKSGSQTTEDLRRRAA